MKSTIFKGRKSGFTLAELLMVIAILLILIGLGVTGFLALRRTIQITKYDDLAREIYVAVQNQLTRLEVGGMDKETVEALKKGTPMPDQKPKDYDKDDTTWQAEKEHFLYAPKSNTDVMELLLPLGAVADDVRSNGFYVIEYNVKTNTVYSVFYSEKSFEYSTVSAVDSFRTSRETRKGPMVGYYGGSSVERDDLETCPTPELEIINTNELRLNILNVPDDVEISVIVSDGVKEPVTLTPADPRLETPIGETGKKTVLFDSILEPNKHFHELFQSLTPGKDLTITVTYSKEGALSSSASITANSLFATRESGEQPPAGGVNSENPGDVVTIAWARHLQNLENTVSHLDDDTITIARQTAHIQWDQAEFGNFVSIRNENANEKLLRYEGRSLEIRDLTGTNGLFAETKQDMTLSGIRVVNPVIDNTDGQTSVGALVGTANEGTRIETCAVYANKINADNTVNYAAYEKCYVNGGTATTGGLIGTATDISVTNSFAALPSITGTGASLIGSATDCTIQNSYANCDNLPEEGTFAYFLKGNGNQITHCYAVGNVANDREENGVFTNGTGNNVTDSYYAVSHRKFAPDPKDNQDLAATEFFYIGNDGTWKETNQEGMQAGMQAGPLDGDWSKGLIAPLSHPYREYLDGRPYPYPAIGTLDHYGSWPDGDGTVDLTIDMKLLNNEAAGYAIFAGRVRVLDTSKTDEQNNPIVLFDSNDEAYRDEDGNYIDQVPPIDLPVVKVVPGTTIRFEIEAEKGYDYFNSQIGFTTSSQPKFEYKIKTDSKAVITFRQNAFQLKGIRAEGMDENGVIKIISDARYYIDLKSPQKTLVVRSSDVTEKVDTGSTVTVRTPNQQGYAGGSVVWYAPMGTDEEAKRVYLTQQGDGSYSFAMPSYNTDVHVRYTKQTAHFSIDFQMMDTDGSYQHQSTQEYSCGVGSQINRSMINAMAETSGLPLVIDGERVRYLAEAVVTKPGGTEEIFHIRLDDSGKLLESPLPPYITKLNESSETNPYKVTIKIARKKYQVTLTADAHVDGVRFGTADEFEDTVSGEFYYGASVTASADVAPGYSFSYWDPQDSRFLMSAEPEYTFQVPHFNLNILATATLNQRLVTINLLNNGESWLYSDPTRRADPITLTLVDTRNHNKEYRMNVLTEDTISYAMQAVVPAVPEYEQGYEVWVDYASGKQSWIYSDGSGDTDAKNTRLRLVVRDDAVEQNVDFYSITYFPVKQYTLGFVPKGGAYPKYYHVKVEGNSGYLRNVDPDDEEKIFCGWKDQYAEGTGSNTVYTGGEVLMLTHRTDMFAQWTNHLNVIYHAGEADGGELPVDNSEYVPTTVTIKWGSLTRKGYQFIGWARTEDADAAEFSKGGTETVYITSDLHLYPVWKQEEYTLRFYDPSGVLLTDEDFVISGKHYGDLVPAPELEVELPGGTKKQITGWSLTPDGPILCQPGENFTVTGNMDLYARLTEDTVTVTYMPRDGNGPAYGTQIFGIGISGYLNCVPVIDDKATPVTAWSTQPNGQGDLYFCREDGRSEKSYAFMENTTLYAVFGKVYNYNKQLWFDTLYAAVRQGNPDAGDTLIVYRDTQEPHNIQFNKDLYVIASGNRSVTWIEGATVEGGNNRLDDPNDEGEFVGCMSVYNQGNAVTLTFGKSDVSTLSMKGSSLTFDANKQSRVISLRNGATFHMYDGITLTNGKRMRTGNPKEQTYGLTAAMRSYYGGGVYAGLQSVFNMHGGTISHCTAFKGGGVYLYADKNSDLDGSKMQMGDMITPTAYSSTAIYYEKDADGYYKNVSNVTAENYKKYYIAVGSPEICYNTATRKGDYVWNYNDWGYDDGGGGLLMLDLKDGDLVLYKGSIHNNTAYANGGGIVSDAGSSASVDGNKAKLRIYEVDISHNTAHGYGGGIYQWQGVVYVYNSTLRQNYAKKSGGGIYLHHWEDNGAYDLSTVEFHYGDIEDNRAGENGGGIYVESRQTMKITHGNLKRNIADGDGGGVYIASANGNDGRLSLEGGTVADNTAQNGGGIYSLGQIAMSGGTLSGNKAENDGGGIWNGNTFITPAKFSEEGDLITEGLSSAGGTISGNTAGNFGGGIRNNGTITMSGSTICDNSARYLGGGIMQWGTLKLSGGRLYGNTDTDYKDSAFNDEFDEIIGPNDIYLVGGNTITIPEGGIQLSGEERVAVDSERDKSDRFNNNTYDLPFRFAVYENVDNFEQEDVLYFTYNGTRSTADYQGLPNHKSDLSVVSHLDVGKNEIGLYLAEKEEGKNRTVTLNANYGDMPKTVQMTGEIKKQITLLDKEGKPVFTRPSYYLAGWARTPDALEEQYELYYDVVANVWRSGYVSGTGWTNQSPTPDYTVQDYFSQTLYAMWKPCVAVYDLGADAAANGVKIQPTSVGPRVTLLNPEPVSYTKDDKDFIFDYWVDSKDSTKTYQPTQRLTLTENLRLNAVWEERKANTVVLTFYYNGGSVGTGGELREQVEVEKGKSAKAPGNVTQSGKVLMGWATTQDALTPDYSADHEFKNLEADLTLYAVWADEVIITYDVNGGKGGSLSGSTFIGGSVTITNTVPERDVHDFLGWAETADAETPKYRAGDLFGPVNQSTTLYAVWRAKVTVKLMMNDGTDAKVSETLESIGSEYTLPKPERTGYTFLGWNKEAGAVTAQYQAEEKISVPAEEVTLYAIWEENPRYKVTLDPNGGTWQDGKTEPIEVSEDENGDLTIPSDIPAQNGKKFLGWSQDAATSAQYQAGTTIHDLTSDLTLHAVWGELDPPPIADAPTQEDPGPADSETQNADPPETEAPTEASAKEDPATSETPAQPETEAPEAPSEAAEQPAAQAAPAPTEEKPVWKVSFYLDGVDFMKHPKLSGKELQACQWDEEEQWLTYTVPAGEDVKLLPPEVKLDGWIFDGWLLLDENEDEETIYPAGEEIPLTDGMALVPLWKEPPPPPTQPAPTAPPATEAPPETQASPPLTQGEETAKP